MRPCGALLGALTALMVTGCGTQVLTPDLSTQRQITRALEDGTPRPTAVAAAASSPVGPARVLPPEIGQSLLPPLRSTLPAAPLPLEPRFDLSVTDAPIGQILHAIVADTRYSVLLSPKLQAPTPPAQAGAAGTVATATAADDKAQAAARRDLITMHLKNVTVFEALDALRETYGYEYSVQGTRVYVQPPELQTRFYQVNYTLGQRRGVSDLQVVAGAATPGGGGSSGSGSSSGSSGSSSGSGSGSGGGGSPYASNQASALTTLQKSDLWAEVEDALRTILGCQIPRFAAQAARTSGSTGSSSQSSSSSRADTSFPGEINTSERLRGVDGCSDGRAVNVNQMTGMVLVRAMPRELRTVERLLRRMQLNIERQVIIEAKVIDVQLNRESQRGINWAGFNNGAVRASGGANPSMVYGNATTSTGTSLDGRVVTGATLADLLGSGLAGGASPNAFSSGLGLALRWSQFSALINFLESQGEVHVLSSPRIATLNNQKAVIKVGVEEPFIVGITPGSTSVSSASAVSVQPTLTYAPFFSGISLDVTPQIDDQDRVTLHVHAMVNSITEKDKASSTAAGSQAVPLAVNSVNETDSVVKTSDGAMVVIGGLMTESSANNQGQVPGLSRVPGAGALFRNGTVASSKRELVIIIRPTVVKSESDWSDDLTATSRRLDDMHERHQAYPQR